MWLVDSACSRNMTGSKELLEDYYEQSGPRVRFGSETTGSGRTEGYGVVNNGRIKFTHVAYVNGLKYNLISVSQLCDCGFKLLFDVCQGLILNQNWEVMLVAPRVGNVYNIDMRSATEEV